MYKLLIRPILFLFQPENAHNLTFSILKTLTKIPFGLNLLRVIFGGNSKGKPISLLGLDFPNQVGLAAGLDKNAEAIDAFAALGFGYIEIGTVTPKAQDGNPKPRMFRLKPDHGIINRMGFNNGGLAQIQKNLKKRKSNVIVGGNIGKNKLTPNEEAVNDYLICFHGLFDLVDYFVVNVSSPNTPGLRALQEKKPLSDILNALMDENKKKEATKPILLKIAPDLTEEQLLDIIDIVKETNIDGLIATNTTIDRSGLITDQSKIEEIGAGGLSGRPVQARSTEVVRFLHEKSNGAFPIIGVGGINSGQAAIEKLQAGASMIQVYSGFVYEGPALIKKINQKIAQN